MCLTKEYFEIITNCALFYVTTCVAIVSIGYVWQHEDLYTKEQAVQLMVTNMLKSVFALLTVASIIEIFISCRDIIRNPMGLPNS